MFSALVSQIIQNLGNSFNIQDYQYKRNRIYNKNFSKSMQWEFRKALQSLDTYKATNKYKIQIERNSSSNGQLLNTIVRQIQLIISKYEELLVPKVLAMRFAKDIMILGKQEVVLALQKLVPHLRAICSYQIGDANPDRGETYFHDHPFYKKKNITQKEKQQIDKLGSTFLILCLQSLYTWAKWIPVNQQGKESIYAQVYNSLLQAGVVFPREFHYYKPSDTEKFKNTYHVEFFDESMSQNDVDNVSSASSSMVSHKYNGYKNSKGRGSTQRPMINVNNNNLGNSMQNSSVESFHANNQPNQHQEFKSETSNQESGTSLQVQMIRNNKQESYQKNFHDAVNYYKNYLNGLISPKDSNGIRFDKLDSLNRKIQKLHQQHTTSNGHLINLFPDMPVEQKLRMEKDCKWLERYILQYSMFNNKIISFRQFTEKVTAQQISIGVDATVNEVQVSKNKKSQQGDTIRNFQRNDKPLNDGIFQEQRLELDIQQRDFSKKNQIKINDVSGKDSRQQHDARRAIRNLELQLFQQRKARQQQKAALISEHQQRVRAIMGSIRNKGRNKTEQVALLQQNNLFLKQDMEKIRVEVNHLKLVNEKLERVVNENGDSRANEVIQEKQAKIILLQKRIREMQQLVQFQQKQSLSWKQRLQTMQNQKKFHNESKGQSVQALQRQIAQKDKRLRNVEKQLEIHKDQLQKQRSRNHQDIRSRKAQTEISSYSQNVNLQKDKAQINNLKKKIRDLQRRCDDLQIEKIELNDRVKQKDKIIRKFKGKIDEQLPIQVTPNSKLDPYTQTRDQKRKNHQDRNSYVYNDQYKTHEINALSHSRSNSNNGKRGIQLTPRKDQTSSEFKHSRSVSTFVRPANQKIEKIQRAKINKNSTNQKQAQMYQITYSNGSPSSGYGTNFDYIQGARQKGHSLNPQRDKTNDKFNSFSNNFNHTFSQSKNSFFGREMTTDNYDSIWSQFNINDKELFMRFCRCALKRKDILYKQNQFQIGLITEAQAVKGNKIQQNLARRLSQTKNFWRVNNEQNERKSINKNSYNNLRHQENSGIMMRFLMHFTNIGEDQIQYVYVHMESLPTNIDCYIENNNPSTTYQNHIQKEKHRQQSQQQINQNFIYCIQPSEQEKIALVFHSNDLLPYVAKPCVIKVSYKKKSQQFTKDLVLPMLSIKMIEYQKPQGSQLAVLPLMGDYRFKFSKRMLPKVTSICSYFQKMQQKIANKLYEVDGKYPLIKLHFRLRIQFSGSQSDNKTNTMRVMVQDLRPKSALKQNLKQNQMEKRRTDFKQSSGFKSVSSPQFIISNESGQKELNIPLTIQQHYIVSQLLAFVEFAFSK